MVDPIPVGKIPSGLFIVTVATQSQNHGFLASWIQQVSFEPLLISMAVKADRPLAEIISNVGRFCVNVVGQDNNGLLKPFWGGLKVGVNPIDLVATQKTARGNVFLSDAMVSLECEWRSEVTPGDHVLIFGEVVESHLLKPDDKPMNHVRKTGANY